MREIQGDIWDFWEQGNWIVITTNGTVKKNKEAVMGRGVALQAKQRFPNLSFKLGGNLRDWGNLLFSFPEHRILTFPVKHQWWEKADIELIEESCQELSNLTDDLVLFSGGDVYMTRPGCGNGRLHWKDVKPILEKYLDDRFIVVERE